MRCNMSLKKPHQLNLSSTHQLILSSTPTQTLEIIGHIRGRSQKKLEYFDIHFAVMRQSQGRDPQNRADGGGFAVRRPLGGLFCPSFDIKTAQQRYGLLSTPF